MHNRWTGLGASLLSPSMALKIGFSGIVFVGLLVVCECSGYCWRSRRILEESPNLRPNSPSGSSSSSKTRTILFTVGASVVGFIGVGLLMVFVAWFASAVKRIRKYMSSVNRRGTDQRTVVPIPDTEPEELVEERDSFNGAPPMTMAELRMATDDFSRERVVGDGGFGLVYKAILANGTAMAVKKLSPDALQGMREFDAEMATLAKVLHENLVEILGYCISGPERLIIYRYMENGSLDEWLHARENTGMVLEWKRRVKIMYGVASGLSYLHHDVSPHIIHRDIKASNILLDSEFQAKIADFGLARFIDPQITHVSTQVAGTMGYMAPEIVGGAIATKQGDVYSFGMLMLEIATGKRPNLKVNDNGKLTLRSWAHTLITEGRFMELLDPEISKSVENCQEILRQFFQIAFQCSGNDPQDRPQMMTVKSQLAALVLQL